MKFYITTPLFYVNALPHIGSAYPTIVTDFIAGHMLQRGLDVCFLTGTDEHGQKIEKAANEQEKGPEEHCNSIAQEFKRLWDLLGIEYDCFVRTSDQSHKDFVKSFFDKVNASGDIYKSKYQGLYCVSCEDFKLEKDLESIDGELCCPVHKQKVENYEQENYFFALSKYEDKLKNYIEENPDFIYPEYRKNEVLGWIKEGLRDFPISRVGINWGIDVPGDEEGQKIYVWFDALLGYISGLADLRGKYWSDDTQIVQIIGKDILRFHAVYWPAMLMSAGYPLPKKVFGHGFLTKDGLKMGKTLGNIIDPVELVNKFGSDAVRFFFARELIFGKDGDFTEETFILRLNADLANNLGNLLNRCLNLVKKYYDSAIPKADFDPAIKTVFEDLHTKFISSIDKINPHDAYDELFLALNKVNAYINEAAPWKVLKEGKTAEAANFIYTGLEACRRSAIYLAPLCPNIAIKIISQLGLLTVEEAENLSRKELLNNSCSFKQLNSYLTSARIDHEVKPIFERLDLIQTK